MALTDLEQQAVVQSLPAVGAFVADIGMEKGLADYSKEQALGLVATCVKEVRKQMAELIGDDVPF